MRSILGTPPWTNTSGLLLARAFKQAFQDTSTTEHTKEKICHLSFTLREVDTFIAKFESLTNEVGYQLDARSTITLFASKHPFRMMDHLYKIVHPHNFMGWAQGACQYHQDNQAVQNIKDIHGDMLKKASQKKVAGFSAAELAKILNVKMPLPIQTLWTHGLIGTVWQIETAGPKEELVPQPQKMWNNCAKKGAASHAINKATSLGISWTNPLITNQPTKRSRKTLEPVKLILMMIKLQMKKIMEALRIIPGSIRVKPSQRKRRSLSSIGLLQYKLGWRLVLKQIFKAGNPVSLGRPAKSRIEDCFC